MITMALALINGTHEVNPLLRAEIEKHSGTVDWCWQSWFRTILPGIVMDHSDLVVHGIVVCCCFDTILLLPAFLYHDAVMVLWSLMCSSVVMVRHLTWYSDQNMVQSGTWYSSLALVQRDLTWRCRWLLATRCSRIVTSQSFIQLVSLSSATCNLIWLV